MLASAKINEDVTLAAPAAFTVPVEATGKERLGCKLNLSGSAPLDVELVATFTVAHSTGGQSIEFTMLHDDGTGAVDLALGAAGLGTFPWPATDTNPRTFTLVLPLKLEPGQHSFDVAFKTAAGDVDVLGANWPAQLLVRAVQDPDLAPRSTPAKALEGSF